MSRLHDLFATIDDALLAVGREVASVWVLIQFAVIILAAVIGTALATLLRRRIDVDALTTGWPPYLRQFTRLLADNMAPSFSS